MKLQLDIEDEEISKEEYKEAIKEMQEEYKRKLTKGKQGRSNSMVKHLIDKTSLQRLKWVQDERSLVSKVLHKFPFLKENRWVCLFCNLHDVNVYYPYLGMPRISSHCIL